MYIECNKAFLDIMGYEREEVMGEDFAGTQYLGGPRNRRRLVEMLRHDSSCRGLEVQFRKKNGEVFWG